MDQLNQILERIESLLSNHNYEGKDYIDVKEAASYLNISKSAIYKMTSNRQLPFYNPGGKKIYFKKSELNNWIESAKQCSIEDYALEVDSYLEKLPGFKMFNR